jgi:hypothetical protein
LKLDKKQKSSILAILALKDRLEALVFEMARRQSGTEVLEGRVKRSAVGEAVRSYQRFLVLHLLHPDQRICPVAPIDSDGLWHAHILDTRAYGDDCQRIFGRFLHHDPNPVDIHMMATQTWELCLKTFSAGAWGKPATILKPLALTKDEVMLASVHSVDCYTGHCGGA